MPRASWRGFLRLSLVSCPIYLSPATTRAKSIRLHQVWQPASVEGGFDRQGEHVADAALGPDDSGRSRIGLELAPQPQDLHVDAAVEDILVHAGRLQQMLAAERSLRRVEKGDQQGIFALGQRDVGSVGIGQTPGAPVELPAAEPAAAPLRIPWRRGARPPAAAARRGCAPEAREG